VEEIRARQSLVALFCFRRHLRDDIVQLLKRIEDASRIVQRFLLGKGDVDDLSAIQSAIEIWGEVKSRIDVESQIAAPDASDGGDHWVDLKRLLSRVSDLRGLALRIAMAVDPNVVNVHSSPDIGPDPPIDDREAVRVNDVAKPLGAGQLKWSIKPE